MKKTLAALIVGAFAASAANAVVIYNNEGSKVELNGSLRLALEKTNKDGTGHSHSGLKNKDSRLEIKMKHDLADDFYALGRVEVRFNGDAKNDDGFGNLYAHRAYVGLGSKAYGQVTFGRQVNIADDLSTAEDYLYGIINKGDYIPTSGKSVVRYDYFGIDGLQLGAGYQFADSRQSDNEVKNLSIDNGFQFGALYNKDGVTAKFAYGRTHFKNTSSDQSHKDGFLTSLAYDFGPVLFSLDAGYAKSKNITADTSLAASKQLDYANVKYAGDSKQFFVSPGFQLPVSEKSKIYGNYKYEQYKQTKDAAGLSVDNKTKVHGFLLGVDYKLHKQVVTYVEGKYLEEKAYVNGNYDGDKTKDKAIGVGMRVFF